MDTSKKQAKWRKERPLFEAELIHTHLLPSFDFNENTGDYEIKPEIVSKTDDEDRKVAYETLNTGWAMWLRAKASVPEGFVLIKNDSKTVVAIERMVEQQVEASGMDSRRLERLDGWRIIEAAVEAQEPSND